MDTITTSHVSDTDKVIRLSIPVAKAGETYRVTVKVEEDDSKTENDWPDGYLERVVGGWQGKG